MSEAQPDEAMEIAAKIAKQINDAKEDEVIEDGDHPDGADDGDDSADNDDTNGRPPNFLSYQEYIDAGKDPAYYQGEKAFQDLAKSIKDRRSLKSDIRGIKSTLDQQTQALGDWKTDQVKQIRGQLEVELAQATEDEDVNAALAAQRKIDGLPDPKNPVSVERREPNVIADFRTDNPIIDRESDDYDELFDLDVEETYNKLAARLTRGWTKELTDNQMETLLEKSMERARRMNGITVNQPGKDNDGESPRNKRASGTRKNRGTRASSAKKTLKDIQLTDTLNPANKNAASDFKAFLEKKYGKGAGDPFETKLLEGEQ